MSTLIKNIGILDARKASPDEIAKIGKILNVGCLVVSPGNKSEFMKLNMQNVAKMLELEDSYMLHAGPMEITRQMLEDADEGIRLCLVGPLDVASDIEPELLQTKLIGLYINGPASVPKKLYGTFMNKIKNHTTISVEPEGAIKFRGKLHITNAYLKDMEDNSDLSVSGNVVLDRDLDEQLFLKKISTLRVAGGIGFSEEQEEMLLKALVKSERTRLKVIRMDFHYVPGGTVVDTFTIMTHGDKTISCYGILILHEEVDSEMIRKKNIRFEAGTVYFPKSVMEEMATRLSKETRGIPYEAGKLQVVASSECMTSARLAEMEDKSDLVVLNELEFDESVDPASISPKIAHLDNYGIIHASRNVTSILQAQLRRNEGAFRIKEEEKEEEDTKGFDNVIENVATYTL